MELVKNIYELSSKFPQSEIYGLTSQMRRCAISIPSNIAEGSHRSTDKEFRQFLFIAFGSGSELETQLEIAILLGFIKDSDEQVKNIEIALNEVMKMLNAMIQKFSNESMT